MIKEISREQIVELFEAAGDAQTLAETILELDLTSKRIPSQERPALISMALKCGREWALELRKQYPAADILFLAKQLGVDLKTSDQVNEIGNIVLRSEYYTQPPQIVVYSSSIKVLEEVIERVGLANVMPPSLIMPIHVAHELFHHIEYLKKDSLSRRYMVRTLGLGPWGLKSGVRALTEIGAHAFVQNWLNLNWYPYVIDQIERLVRGDTTSPIERWNDFVKKRGFGGAVSRFLSGRKHNSNSHGLKP